MRVRVVLGLFLAIALGLSACGSSDDSSSSDDTDSGSDNSLDVGNDDFDNDDIENLTGIDDECIEFATAFAELAGAPALALGAGEEEVEDFQNELDQLDSSVPSEIQDDFEVFQTALADLFDAMANSGITSSEFQEATEAMDSDEITEASDNIEAWLEENCTVTG